VTNYIYLLLGIILAAVGGELFVRGSIGLARGFRVAPGVIGATVAAFATSSPEVTVSVTGALAGKPSLGLGDTLGSNVFNIAFILGLALLGGAIRSPRDSVSRDFPVALLVPFITAILIYDGEISRFDGIILLGIFAVWLTAIIREAGRQRAQSTEPQAKTRVGRPIIESAIGISILIAAGSLIVSGASSIAVSYGVDPFIIGATIVAAGTSVPELATTVMSRIRGQDDIGLGTILGSNIFNGLFIVGIAACITPIPVPFKEVAPALAFGAIAVAVTYPGSSGVIGLKRGAALLSVYGVYLALVLQGV
jgi:cation:H+ antiporter